MFIINFDSIINYDLFYETDRQIHTNYHGFMLPCNVIYFYILGKKKKNIFPHIFLNKFLSDCNVGQQDESLCKNYISDLKDLRLRIEGCESGTVARIRKPMDTEPLKECIQKTTEQKVQWSLLTMLWTHKTQLILPIFSELVYYILTKDKTDTSVLNNTHTTLYVRVHSEVR